MLYDILYIIYYITYDILYVNYILYVTLDQLNKSTNKTKKIV